jgi:hypothetical protein
MLSWESILTNGIYFYFEDAEFDGDRTHYVTECLASGFKHLNIPCFSNLTHDLFITREICIDDGCLYIFQVTEESYSPQYMEAIADFATEHKVIICMADMSNELVTPFHILSFMTHENRFLQVIGDRIPWAFGLSPKILNLTDDPTPFAERNKVILRNFRPSFNQSLRNCLDFCLVPHLEKHFAIDRAISSEYFNKLKTSFGCLSYGGHFREDITRNPTITQREEFKHHPTYFKYLQEPVITRWDSWRWWESLAAGCLTFHVDFEKYGFQLPVMPEPWKHYIPIDLADPKGTVEHLMDTLDQAPAIAQAGREWARKHYSPEIVAQRFLSLVVSHTVSV